MTLETCTVRFYEGSLIVAVLQLTHPSSLQQIERTPEIAGAGVYGCVLVCREDGFKRQCKLSVRGVVRPTHSCPRDHTYSSWAFTSASFNHIHLSSVRSWQYGGTVLFRVDPAMKLRQRLILLSVFALVGFVALILILQLNLPNSTAKDESIDNIVVKSLKTSKSTLATSSSNSRGDKSALEAQGGSRDNRKKLSSHEKVQNVTAATEGDPPSFEDSWNQWLKWVRNESLYPQDAFWSPEMNGILQSLATAPVTSFGLGHKGTQLKATMHLAGSQKTVFKPMRSRTSTLCCWLISTKPVH